MFRQKMLILSVATLSALGILGTSTGCSADLSDSMAGPAEPATTTHLGPMKTTSTDTAPGGAKTNDTTPSGEQADKATQVHMSIVNSTHQVLNLTSATSSGGSNHWQNRPTTTLQPGQQEIVSNYAAKDAQIDLTYTGATDGAVFTLHGKTPLAGDNQASGSTNSTSYAVNAQAASGYNPTFNYYLQPGHTFTYTGGTQTFTVPVGVTSLKVNAEGGAGGVLGDFNGAAGAQISGTLAVTPGEVLTIGVGGSGNGLGSNSTGGWGMTNGSSSFSGGNGISGNNNTSGGGGATVVQDPTGQLVVVAGGGGGHGGSTGEAHGYAGGEGGAGGSLIGGNGEPGINSGGKPGANTVSQGQDSQGGGDGDGGAGGGGINGGMAGISGTGGGGGAGSSSDAGLTNPSVGTGSANNGPGQYGSVTLSPGN